MKSYAIPFFIALFLLAGVSAFGAEVTALAAKKCDFALDPDSGTLAAIDDQSKTISFYDNSLLLQKSINLQSKPVSLVWKKVDQVSYFVVTCQNKNEVLVFDAASYEQVKSIESLAQKPCSLVASTNPQDPYIYYANGRGIVRSYRINLCTFERQQLKNDAAYMMISASGKYLYSKHWYRDPDEYCYMVTSTGLVLVGERRVVGKHIIDPLNNYIVIDNTVYSMDLKDCKGRLGPGEILAILPDRPVVLSWSQGGLMLLRSQNFSQIRKHDIPDKFLAGLQGGPSLCLVDAKRQFVLLFRNERVLKLSYAELQVPDEPFLTLNIEDERRFAVGQSVSLAVKALDKRVKFEIAQAPQGMKLKEGKLVWKPQRKDIGIHKITLRAYFGDIESFVHYEISVYLPSSRLPCSIHKFAVSDDGKSAVLIRKGSTYLGTSTDFSIVLFDLVEGKETARKTFSRPIQTVFMDDYHVYVSFSNFPMFYVLDRADLKKVKRVFCDKPVRGFDRNREGCLAAVKDKWGREVSYFTLPEVELEKLPASTIPANSRYNYMRSDRPIYGQENLQDGYYIRSGAVYDAEGKLALILRPRSYSNAILNKSRAYDNVYLWNRCFSDSQIKTPDGVSWGKNVNGSALILEKYPALICADKTIIFGDPAKKDDSYYRLELVIRDLITGQVRKTLLLEHDKGVPAKSGVYLVERNNIVYVFFQRHIFTVRLTPELFAGIETPLYIEPKVDTQVVSITKPTTIKYRVKSGSGGYAFTLINEHEALAINPKTGEVRIDGPAILKAILDVVRSDIAKAQAKVASDIDDMELLDSLYSKNISAYEEMLGAKPGGIPFTIPVTIRVIDSENQSCRLTNRLYVVAPYETMLKLVKEERAKVDVAPKAPPPSNLRRLRSRINALQAQIAILIEMVEQEVGNGEDDDDDDESAKEQPTNNDAKKEDE